MNANTSLLLDVVDQRLPPPAQGWTERALRVLAGGAPPDRAAFLNEFAAATRRLGKASIDLGTAQYALAAAGIVLPQRLGLDELGRVWMLIAIAELLSEGELESLVDDCYQHGDNRERQSVLRALPLLPGPARFVPLAVDACRTHVVPVFEAIACENPLPAAFFPDLNFNQMVLKTLFLGLALDRIVRLDARLSPELERMARSYASERYAAGRSVPADIERLYLGGGPTADGQGASA
jgi:hypothetical protein